jgi:hypothetical protein
MRVPEPSSRRYSSPTRQDWSDVVGSSFHAAGHPPLDDARHARARVPAGVLDSVTAVDEFLLAVAAVMLTRAR